VLLRVSYPVQLTKNLQLTPGFLPIYHLMNDSFVDDASMRQELNGSQGLTLNTTLYLDYLVNENHSFQINMGSPLLVRQSRPDGLTRSFVATLEYRFRF
jgi:hypothetical protein